MLLDIVKTLYLFLYLVEPGYYEAGQFGIRLENIVMVKNASTTVNINPCILTDISF